MDLNTFIRLYQEFLYECMQKGWSTEVLIEEFGNYLTAIKSMEGIEVQFFIELDRENCEKINDKTHQGNLKYGVLREKGKGDLFAKEVLDAFHQYWAKHSHKKKTSFILYKR
ncbi:hypothetical protein RCG17_28165 [Neobacillus sp. PS3-12]|jgi:hypothetical protein|uniref:hypothetical protein n=1 Tax=Neobacillus sp. PS3-12 TaxID=3070677 RepID=UPI0027DF5F9C|nr:hypothetical protein [Neobacillus sp. PS3-12]WML53158.1 hypothetical protein RCG17_28165 [Neobacillus sp. PS3-12]